MNKDSLMQIGLPQHFSGAIIVGVTSKVDPSVFARLSQLLTQYLTQQEVAWLFQVDIRTIRTYSRNGVLQAYRYGHRVFYKRDELFSLINSWNF